MNEQLDTEMSGLLESMCTEAEELRHSVSEPSTEETLTDLHDRLVRTRQAQDRIEGILAKLIRLRGKSRRTVRTAKGDLDEKLNTVIRGSRVVEYSTAREREAVYDLGCFQQKRGLLITERMLAEVEMAHEFVSLLHRGIDGSRRDIDLRIRVVSLESRLEY